MASSTDSKNAMYNTIGTFFYFMCQWMLSVICVRMAGYEAAGVFSMVIAVTNIFGNIANYGIRNFQVTDTACQYSDYDYLHTRTLTCAISFGCMLVSLVVLRLGWMTSLCCIIYVFFKFAECYMDLFFGCFQQRDLYKHICWSYIIRGIASVASFVLGLWLTHSLLWALVLNTVVLIVTLVLVDGPLMMKLVTITRYKGKPLLKKCFPLMLYTLMVPYLTFVTRYAVELRYGEDALGYFSSITMVLSVLMLLMNAIYVALIPSIAKWGRKKRGSLVFRSVLKESGLLLALLFVGLILGAWLGTPVFSLLFTPAIADYMYLLPWTIVTSVILAWFTLLNSVMTALRHIKSMIRANVACVIICTVTVYPFVLYQGMNGALYSMALSLMISSLMLSKDLFDLCAKINRKRKALRIAKLKQAETD